jgi:hypothetical protein
MAKFLIAPAVTAVVKTLAVPLKVPTAGVAVVAVDETEGAPSIPSALKTLSAFKPPHVSVG